MKIVSLVVTVVLVLNAYGLAYPAESENIPGPQAATKAEKTRMEIQKRGVGERSRVRIRLHDRTELKGYISQIDATSFQLTEPKTSQVSTIRYDSVDKVKGGMSTASKIAIGVGVGVAVFVTVVALVVASWHGN